jgi:glycosyltransferase involved in cell wall biosynthesis
MGQALGERGRRVVLHALQGSWPWPRPDELAASEQLLAAIPRGEPVVADGLLWPGLGALRQQLARSNPVVVLVHSLLDKEGADDALALIAAEMSALGDAALWIATSPTMGRRVAERLGHAGPAGVVVCPGTAPAPRAPGSAGHQLLSVGTVTPRKGTRQLIEAVAGLEDPEWRLDIVGALHRDSVYAGQVRADIERACLGGRITLHGELSEDALEAAYGRADILVHAAHFEAFGMCLTEAIARGIPVLSTPAGALEVLPEAAVHQVPAGEPGAMTAALEGLLASPEQQHRMGRAAAAAQLPTWAEAAVLFEAAIEGLG